MQERKFDKARTHLQKVAGGPSKSCPTAPRFISASATSIWSAPPFNSRRMEEHFDYAVSLMNVGDYVSAREHLEKLSKQSPKSDYVAYGLAALDCLTGHVEDSLRHLDDAIRLNSTLRFQARNDSDFQNLVEDPRFTEILYPDPGGDMPAEPAIPEEEL